MRFAVFLLLVFAMAAPAMALDTKGYVHHQVVGPLSQYGCEAYWLDNGYYQNQGYVYGNAFDFGYGGILDFIAFWHSGWHTWSGPSQYNLRVYDDLTCTEIATIGPFTAADAYDFDVEEAEYLGSWGINVTGQVGVLLEPLSCAAPNDCYPCVYFDQTGTFDGCDRVFAISYPDCSPFNNGDFVFRVELGGIGGSEGACCYPDGHCEVGSSLECGGVYQGDGTDCYPNPCMPTPSRSTSWGQIKTGYRW